MKFWVNEILLIAWKLLTNRIGNETAWKVIKETDESYQV